MENRKTGLHGIDTCPSNDVFRTIHRERTGHASKLTLELVRSDLLLHSLGSLLLPRSLVVPEPPKHVRADDTSDEDPVDDDDSHWDILSSV